MPRCFVCAEIERTGSYAVCPYCQPALYAELVSPPVERDEREQAA